MQLLFVTIYSIRISDRILAIQLIPLSSRGELDGWDTWEHDSSSRFLLWCVLSSLFFGPSSSYRAQMENFHVGWCHEYVSFEREITMYARLPGRSSLGIIHPLSFDFLIICTFLINRPKKIPRKPRVIFHSLRASATCCTVGEVSTAINRASAWIGIKKSLLPAPRHVLRLSVAPSQLNLINGFELT